MQDKIHGETNKSLNNNMATAIKVVKPFEGEVGEDVTVWLRDTLMICRISGLSGEETSKVIILALRGKALSWASQTIQNDLENVSLEGIVDALKKRFGAQRNSDMTLSRFLNTQTPISRQDFSELLKDATTLMVANLISMTALAQMVVNKAPMEIKALLFQTAVAATSWEEFVQKAEEVAWIAFPDKLLARVEQTRKYENGRDRSYQRNHPRRNDDKNKSGKKFCTIHGECGHFSRDCRRLTEVLQEERKRSTRGVNSASEADDVRSQVQEETREDIGDNKNFSCLCSRRGSIGNPFLMVARNGGTERTCLLDTGADVSIVGLDDIEEEKRDLLPYSSIIKAANGQPIKIVGRQRHMTIDILGEEVSFSPLVMEHTKHIILGVDVLWETPQLVLKILKKGESRVWEIRKEGKKEENIDEEFGDLFRTEIGEYNLCTTASHEIDTGDSKPIFQRNARIPIHFEKEITEEIEKNLRLGVIRPSKSSWCSRTVPVRKPDGTLRLCIDFRALNAVTLKDKYPLPRIDEILDDLAEATVFSTLDATSGYYQLAMEEKDKEKTAFAWKGGLYEFNRMPFGLCNAAATFQRAMDEIFRKENRKFVIPYLDDIIIYSRDESEHRKHLRTVLGKVRAAGLSLNRKKCHFYKTEVKILGNIVSAGTIKADPAKVETIQRYPTPTTIKELRSFLGLANYCRQFIPGFAMEAAPMFALLKGEKKASNKKIFWGEQEKDSFHRIRKLMGEHTERAQPDRKGRFILTTDASEKGIGAILAQKDQKGRERMIAAFSRTLSTCQLNYSVTDKELLGVVKGIENFRHYLLGREFTLRTDHKALTYLWETRNPNSRLLRWALRLQEFAFTPEYVKGEENVADGPSRITPREERQVALAGFEEPPDKETILKEVHEVLGHGSSNNMSFYMADRYRWPNMFKDIKEFCRKCSICLRSGGALSNTKNRVIETSRPNELWEVDLLGRICEGGGSRFIFVAIDHFSKWVETRVIENKSAAEIVRAIKELILDRHGTPERILSDNGLEFGNKQIQQLAEGYGFTWVYSSPYHHQTVGAVERVNQTLMRKLKKISDFGRKHWAPLVEKATLAVNLSYNRAIGTSPYILRHGTFYETTADARWARKGIKFAKQDLFNRRREIFHTYKKAIEKGKKTANPHVGIGDRVLIFREAGSGKLGAQWIGGFTVVGEVAPDAFIVNNKDSGSTVRVNKRHIKRDTGFFLGEEVS
ncbi:MAG: reverse transcriptase domain-containing protein [Clostridium sp.]|uniref:reverse transcriptase domain-containing protein n=1 Tax=Clostridium sp. TaxID=1506 RepID=UPI003F2E8CFC